jgi:DNA-binding transcriptional MerR regulator
MNIELPFTETTTAIAREVPCASPTVRHYTDLGWLPHIVTSNGIRLYQKSVTNTVRQILARRLANRGGVRG